MQDLRQVHNVRLRRAGVRPPSDSTALTEQRDRAAIRQGDVEERHGDAALRAAAPFQAAGRRRRRGVRAQPRSFPRSLISKRARVEPKLLADESVDLRHLPVTARPTRTVAR